MKINTLFKLILFICGIIGTIVSYIGDDLKILILSLTIAFFGALGLVMDIKKENSKQ